MTQIVRSVRLAPKGFPYEAVLSGRTSHQGWFRPHTQAPLQGRTGRPRLRGPAASQPRQPQAAADKPASHPQPCLTGLQDVRSRLPGNMGRLLSPACPPACKAPCSSNPELMGPLWGTVQAPRSWPGAESLPGVDIMEPQVTSEVARAHGG